MSSTSRLQFAAVLTLALLSAGIRAQDDESSRVTSYPVAYFEASRPKTAFDMLSLTPGYTFVDSDPDVRGLASAVGNVLIDGDVPTTKHESLEDLLRRLPAQAVERIELIRSGAREVDMHGFALLANIVRLRQVQTHGTVKVQSTVYAHEPILPQVAADFMHETESRRMEVSVSAARTLGDEHGMGKETHYAPTGTRLDELRIEQAERERSLELAAAYEQPALGGELNLNGVLTRERKDEGTREQGWFPDLERKMSEEDEQTDESELGLRYSRALGESKWETLGLYRTSGEDEMETSTEEDELSLSREALRASEAILRTLLQRAFDRWSVEAGIEVARNVLRGRSALNENGVDIALPAASVRVQEDRGEIFVASSWRTSPHWTLEGGLRLESSELVQEGDSDERRSFFFAKPRLAVSYAVSSNHRWRFLLERRVGQLDFGDFVSSASLADEYVTAGNPELVPQRSWVAELAWEREFTSGTAAMVAVRREWITDVIDRIPVAAPEPLDAVGNIAEGSREELELIISAPLTAVGLNSGLLKANLLLRNSRTRDPLTGETREIAQDSPIEASLQFTHNLSQRVHWGLEAEFSGETQEFIVDEVRTERLGPEVNVFVQYTPSSAWSIEMELANLARRDVESARERFAGARGMASLDSIEIRTIEPGRSVSVSVRRSFGK
jgi:outer membrane receptor for ferrienterochelin and colicin